MTLDENKLKAIGYLCGCVLLYLYFSTNIFDSCQSQKYAGTYEVKDRAGNKAILILKGNKTGTLKIEGNGTTYYCSWEESPLDDDEITLGFSNEYPTLIFNNNNAKRLYYPVFKVPFFYANIEAFNAKNPNLQLMIIKKE